MRLQLLLDFQRAPANPKIEALNEANPQSRDPTSLISPISPKLEATGRSKEDWPSGRLTEDPAPLQTPIVSTYHMFQIGLLINSVGPGVGSSINAPEFLICIK